MSSCSRSRIVSRRVSRQSTESEPVPDYITRREWQITYIEKSTEAEQSLQFSAQVVQRFYDTLFKIGLENSLGWGGTTFGVTSSIKIVDVWDIEVNTSRSQ